MFNGASPWFTLFPWFQIKNADQMGILFNNRSDIRIEVGITGILNPTQNPFTA